MITAKIIADSISPLNCRLTTFLLTYPRFTHSEFMTHRVFSRNAASSRARPISHLIREAEFEPAIPIFWGKNQKGMQAMEELEGIDRELTIESWNFARLDAIKHAKMLNHLGLHKQLVNRILEPYTHITVLCSATEYGNFFNLRAHVDAQPEIQELAFQMLNAYETSVPNFLNVGEWHFPFADKFLTDDLCVNKKLEICTARAARLSYMTFDNRISYDDDKRLHDDLVKSGHWSPFEHCAVALDNSEFRGNFRGWLQYRKLFQNENRVNFEAKKLREARYERHAKKEN